MSVTSLVGSSLSQLYGGNGGSGVVIIAIPVA